MDASNYQASERGGNSANAISYSAFMSTMGAQGNGNGTWHDLVDPGASTFDFDGVVDRGTRYVRHPTLPGVVIDMRHFLVVCIQGEVAGLGVELLQLVKDRGSAFNSQDFMSNAMGTQFFDKMRKDTDGPSDSALKADGSLGRRLGEFFKSRDCGDVGL